MGRCPELPNLKDSGRREALSAVASIMPTRTNHLFNEVKTACGGLVSSDRERNTPGWIDMGHGESKRCVDYADRQTAYKV